MSKKKNNKPKVEPINWLESGKRLMKVGMLMNPLVMPQIYQAIDLERANAGAGEDAFKKAARMVIDDEDLIAAAWKNILATLVNQFNGYCW